MLTGEECNIQNLCGVVSAHENDIAQLWDEVYGERNSRFVAIGNIGGATDTALADDEETYSLDTQQISKGAMVVKSMAPEGLFIVGGMNFDADDSVHYRQEAKLLNPFPELYMQKKLWPVMDHYDFNATVNSAGTIDEKMNETVLRIFPYLPDAKRFYSVYDQKSNTEFFVLSSGRRKDYNPDESTAAAFVFPNDPTIDQEQYMWLVNRCSSTQAKNRVVIFATPFASIVDAFRGEAGQGDAQVKTDFSAWNFESLGIKLVITGHSGNSFRIRKGGINIVNSSAFLNTRMGLALSENDDNEPPVVTDTFGDQGYSIEYFSHRPMGVAYPGVPYPDDEVGDYITPKTEAFVMDCYRDKIVCKFISWDTTTTTVEGLLASKTVEHEFEISSL